MEKMKAQFYDALIDISETERKMRKLLLVMNVLEDYYSLEEQRELKSILGVLTDQVQLLQLELQEALEKVNKIESKHK